MTDDREKLAREMREPWMDYSRNTAPSYDCADIAIAYADRRVAEAQERIADELYEWCVERFDPNDQRQELCGSAVLDGVDFIRALSPAREGGKT